MSMPYNQAKALALHGSLRETSADQLRLERAATIFERLGCVYDLAATCKLQGYPSEHVENRSSQASKSA